MSLVEFRGMHVHQPCGAEVVMVLAQLGEQPTASTVLGGTPTLVDRRLRDGVEMVFHRCQDYIDWHRVEPDRRDPGALELPAGWRPRPLSAPLAPPLPLPDVLRAL